MPLWLQEAFGNTVQAVSRSSRQLPAPDQQSLQGQHIACSDQGDALLEELVDAHEGVLVVFIPLDCR